MLLVTCAFLLLVIIDLLPKEARARHASQEAEIRRIALEERTKTLEAETALLESARGQESYVRRTRDVAREGEEVIMVVAEKKQDERQIDPLPWYRRVMGWFGR